MLGYWTWWLFAECKVDLLLLFHDDGGKVGGRQAHVDPVLLVGGGFSFIWGVENMLAGAVSF